MNFKGQLKTRKEKSKPIDGTLQFYYNDFDVLKSSVECDVDCNYYL